MPYKSKKQKDWMHINEPGVAKKWDDEEKEKRRKARNKRKAKKRSKK